MENDCSPSRFDGLRVSQGNSYKISVDINQFQVPHHCFNIFILIEIIVTSFILTGFMVTALLSMVY